MVYKWQEVKPLLTEIVFSLFAFFLIFRLLVNIIFYFLFPVEFLDPLYPLYEWQWYAIWFGLPVLAGLLLSVRYHNKLLAHLGKGVLILVVWVYATIGVSLYLLWNYPFKRPAVFGELLKAKQILAITDFHYEPPDSIQMPDDTQTIKALDCTTDFYYCLLGRPLIAFREAEASFNLQETMPVQAFVNILSNIKNNNLLPEPASPQYYESANTLTARIIKFITTENKIYYHVSIRTGEVDNDHYALCEFLMNKALQILKKQFFYYDVAGVEFLEYSGLPIILETFTLLITTILLTIGYCFYGNKFISSSV